MAEAKNTSYKPFSSSVVLPRQHATEEESHRFPRELFWKLYCLYLILILSIDKTKSMATL